VKEKDETFRDAMRDVSPIKATNRVEPYRPPRPPLAAKRHEDERAVIEELARLTLDDDAEIEEDASYLRPGLPRDILRKLRRTHWVIQDDLDLHGFTGEEAAVQTAVFLAEARRRGLRCVRIVHGKGLRSAGREPVLRKRIRKLLTRRDEVLAFVEPRGFHGGSGAVVVLLEA
jgi:DNA-nicking Smr family endonuclease